MTPDFLLICRRIALIAVLVRLSIAQDAKCYYPNGEEAPEKPCSTAEGSMCCPDKWECLDNGLCYYEPDDLHGRYSCTDQSWESLGCPSNLCTDVSGVGGEDIRQCSNHDDQWCCNADNVNVKCCDEWPEPRPFFDLAQGQAFATIGSDSTPSENPTVATITGLASGTGDGNSQQPSTPASSSLSQDGSSESPSPTPTDNTMSITSHRTSVSSGSGGPETVETETTYSTPTSTSTQVPSSDDSDSGNSNIGVIVGCAVGIPLAIALVGIVAWLLRKRRKQKNHPYAESAEGFANNGSSPEKGSPEFAGGAKLHKPGTSYYRNEASIPELGGQGVGPGRPISTIKGRAELDSGAGFAPGTTPHAPHLVGVGGGHTVSNSWGSAPPGYSPGMHGAQFAAHNQTPDQTGPHEMPVDLPVEAPTGGVVDNRAGTEGNATEGGRYIPYRPPESQQGPPLQNLPEMPELSAVTTPPESKK
ncbi:hypothetical protein CC78DRAFT_530226 [Lojkania enalia]|uniref:Mid2 domain-containing protein n=1 Tax=Lojkania enalia TaxID=147567 RepID=A0A9P4KI66_9PLEO|nr:hypothetical protein CC78DRAFT_530226 [Didymosphaeria enalia]